MPGKQGGMSLLVAAIAVSFGSPGPAQETVTYSYDSLGRLTNTQIVGGPSNGASSSYALDPAGNRTNVTVSTGGGSSSCSFAAHDATGNDEFTFDVVVERAGACSGNVQISYTTDYYKNPSGTLTFTPQDTWKAISIPSNCCGTTTSYYHIHISILSGSASVSDADAVATVFGNG